MTDKLIVLDRDGVINYDSDDYIRTVDEWIALPGAMQALGKLTKAGYKIAIATNQSGIARQYFSEDTLDAMHTKMRTLAQEEGAVIDYIAYCPHGPDDNCDCRKPLPGLIHQIAKGLNQDVGGCYMVGDSLRDLQAGQAAGLRPVLVLTGKGQRTLDKGKGLEGVPVYDDLAAFVDNIID
ncbi:MAG: D-glycero-beta-D-manno-heptose 1,7-bisphosphate 7-phosphatase [Gammaproteobacteria bacterium]|nr:D-glycero-beta-D-manno-heptose 1,7-bisphosphate 7-phosphatase [Gammaproteobacteria bacterium]